MLFIKKHVHLHHKGTTNLETKRFYLRKFKKDDVCDVYYNWTSCKEAAQYNAWNVHDSIDVTKNCLSEWISEYINDDYYHWAITDKVSDEVIGSISVSNIKNKNCEIGYTITSKLWNKGIATEVLIEVLKYLTKDIGFTRIRAMHDVKNKASGRVMDKAGMTFVKHKRRIFLNKDKFIMNCSVYEYKT